MTSTQGKLIVISGPSGAGKTTLVHELFRRMPQLIASVSATTRPPRPGEMDGVDYHFLTAEEFRRRQNAGEFLEACQVFGRGYWYGTLLEEVSPGLAAGKSIVLEIDVHGAIAVQEKFPQVLLIFIRPTSLEELEQRLRHRGTDSEESIQRRLESARGELLYAPRYPYQVTNDQLDRAADELCKIIQTNT